jgi:hypothetical protein
MSLYYRTSDARVLDLDPAHVATLSAPKRATLLPYTVDPTPTPSATQYVTHGSVVVENGAARKTWLLVNKTAEQLATDQFVAQRETDLAQIRTVYAALKAGTGTTAERIRRCEIVLARLLKDLFGGEPA